MRYVDSNVIRTGEMGIPCPCCGTSRALEVIMKGHTQEARDAEKAEAVETLYKEGWRICNVSDQDKVQSCPHCSKVWEDMYGVRP